MNFSMDVSGDIKGYGYGQFDSPENAELFKDAVKGGIAAVKLANSQDRQMIDIINKISVENDGAALTVEFDMTRAEVEKLIKDQMNVAYRLGPDLQVTF